MKKRSNNVVEKEKDDSSESNSRSAANQIDDKALPNKFTGNATCEKVHEGEGTVLASQTDVNSHVSDQGGCVEPTSTSEQSKCVLYITQKERDLLKGQAAKLKRKNKKMSRELRKYVDMCMELQDDNKLIMDTLKQVYQPSVIQMLEAKNPYNNPQTDPEME